MTSPSPAAPVTIVFWTILSLGPIPLWHLLLHSFLPLWKKSPWAFYGAATSLWGLFVPLSHELACRSWSLFMPSGAVKLFCLCVGVAAFLIALWSIQTLTPRRFFAWAVLHPETNPPELIRRGPYRFTAHPTYLAILVAVGSSFLASGEVVLLGAFLAMGLLLALVVVLEHRELRTRLNASVPSPEIAAHPSSKRAPALRVDKGE